MPDSFPFSSGFRLLLEDAVVEYVFRANAAGVESGQATNTLSVWPNGGQPQVLEIPQRDPFKAEIADFIRAVETGIPSVLNSPMAGIEALRLAVAADESMRTGNVVSL